MDLGIENKKALVLASSKGLGKSVAINLASEGVHVFLNGRNEETLLQTQKEVMAVSEKKVDYIVGDVSKRSGRQQILNAVHERFGHIDILVTNSGGPPFGAFEQHDDDSWKSAYDLLLESTVGMIRGVLPAMKERRWGRILTITSQAVKQPVEGLVLSNAVRASVVGLVKTLASELGPHNITVNNIMPGFTRTERLESLAEKNPNFMEVTDTIPLRRIGEPHEFAAAVTFLASERASYITGVSLAVDGGWIRGV